MEMRIEHHASFTAVYIGGQLAAMTFVGTVEQRMAVPDAEWCQMATYAAEAD